MKIFYRGCVILLLVQPTIVTAQQADDDAELKKMIGNLRSDDINSKMRAALRLQKKWPLAKNAIPDLIANLGNFRVASNGKRVAEEVSRALASIGKPAHTAVMKELESDDIRIYTAATGTVKMMMPQPPDGALELFLKNAETVNDPQRLWVTQRALVDFGIQAKPAVARMIDLLEHENFRVQVSACEILGAVGPESSAAVPKLFELLKTGITSTRGHAALALGKIGPVEGHDVAAALLAGAQDVRASVRERSLESLGRFGKEAAGTAPTLRELMERKSYNNRTHAAVALVKVGGDAKAAADFLCTKLEGQEDLDALDALKRIGPPAVSAVPRLLESLEHTSPDIRIEAALALEKIAPDSDAVRKAIQKLRKDKDADTRAVAAAILKRFKQKK